MTTKSVEEIIKCFPDSTSVRHIEDVTNGCGYCGRDFLDKDTAITNDKGAVCLSCLKSNNYKYRDKFGMFSKIQRGE